MTTLERYRNHLESARHDLGHAMAHAAQGLTIQAEKDFAYAQESIDAACKMLDSDFCRNMFNPIERKD